MNHSCYCAADASTEAIFSSGNTDSMVGKWWIICQGHHRPNKCVPVLGFEENRALCLCARLFLWGTAHFRLWNPALSCRVIGRTMQGTECALLGTERQCKSRVILRESLEKRLQRQVKTTPAAALVLKIPYYEAANLSHYSKPSHFYSVQVWTPLQCIMNTNPRIIKSKDSITRTLHISCLFPISAGLVQIWTCLSQEHPHCERVAAGPACRCDRPQGLPSQTIFEVGYRIPGDKHYRKIRVLCWYTIQKAL